MRCNMKLGIWLRFLLFSIVFTISPLKFVQCFAHFNIFFSNANKKKRNENFQVFQPLRRRIMSWSLGFMDIIIFEIHQIKCVTVGRLCYYFTSTYSCMCIYLYDVYLSRSFYFYTTRRLNGENEMQLSWKLSQSHVIRWIIFIRVLNT